MQGNCCLVYNDDLLYLPMSGGSLPSETSFSARCVKFRNCVNPSGNLQIYNINPFYFDVVHTLFVVKAKDTSLTLSYETRLCFETTGVPVINDQNCWRFRMW